MWTWRDFFGDEHDNPPEIRTISAETARARMMAFGASVQGYEMRRAQSDG